MRDQPSFKSGLLLLVARLDLKHPFGSERRFSERKQDKVPSVVLGYGTHFIVHSSLPARMSQGLDVRDRFCGRGSNNSNVNIKVVKTDR
jgi:hypothetical protein